MDDRRNHGGQRFVFLRHEMPQNAVKGSHWDLMLEKQGVLLTWELPELPPSPLPATFEQLGIRRLPDHRIEYLKYEGPVSNGRGAVRRVDFGVYQLTTRELSGFVHATLRGRSFLIELRIDETVFSQVEHPSSDAGQLLSFKQQATAGE